MYSKAILSTHCFVPIKEITLEGMRSLLTIKSKYSEDTEVKLYQEEGDWFGLPMYHRRGLRFEVLRVDD